jgi:hypothetical protein
MNNSAFHSLMKTGRPKSYITSAETVSCDVKNVFVGTCRLIAKMLQVNLQYKTMQLDYLLMMPQCQSFSGTLNFATDTWTLHNHKVYVALTMHLECNGKLLSTLLNVVKVPKSHSGVNLAIMFTEVLETFGIKEKV